MRCVLLVFVMFFCLDFSCWAKLDVRFTPSQECEDYIINFINNSKDSIDIAVYSINNDKIIAALKKAKDRGVKLRILTDKLQASSKSSKVIDLYRYGINIRVNSRHKIEHNKFAIYDNKVASTGSYNWTNPASYKNSENCLFITNNREIITKYAKRFEQLWIMNTKKKSTEWFEKKMKD